MRRLLAFWGFVFVVVVTACTSTTSGAGTSSGGTCNGTCTQWNVSGRWSTEQSNGYSNTFELSQSGTSISGVATGDGQGEGKVSGSLSGNKLSLTVTWPDGVVGKYSATVSEGALSGTTQDAKGGPTATWTGTGPTGCDSCSASGSSSSSSSSSSSGGSSSGGPCTQYDIAGAWSTQQSNGYSDPFQFSQTGTTLGGTAGSSKNGRVSGTLRGNKLTITVTWPDGVVGRYDATVSEGALSGTTQDAKGGPTASWTGTGPTKCAD